MAELASLPGDGDDNAGDDVRPSFFISYTHADEDKAEWIAYQLKAWNFRVRFQKWDSVPGVNWPRFMTEAARSSEKTIAVLSPAYLDGTFTWTEWQAAWLADPHGQARKLIPVLVEPTDVTGTPLAQITWLSLVGLDREAARQVLWDGITSNLGGAGSAPGEPLFPIPTSRGRAALPPLVVQVVPRPDVFASVMATVAAGRITVLTGMAGAGKSTLARQVIDSTDVGEVFSDGVRWLKVGADADIGSVQAALARQLGGNLHGVAEEQRRARLREIASAASVLVVLDDVWSREVLDAIDVAVGSCGVLVTTRDAGVVDMSASICPVGLVDDSLGRRILAAWAGSEPDELPPPAAIVVERCGGVPLALAAAGGMVAAGFSWDGVVKYLDTAALDQLRVDIRGYSHPTVLAAVDAGVRALTAELRDAYMALVVFDDRGAVPIEMVTLLWGTDVVTAIERLAGLTRRSLVQRNSSGESFTLHDLQFQYLQRLLDRERVRAAHGRIALALLERWGGLDHHLPAVGEPSFGTAPVERYGLAHLVSHLTEAGMENVVHDLLAAQTGAFEVFGGPVRPTNLWFRAHDRIGDVAGFLRDVNQARRMAAAATAIAVAAGEPAPSAGLEVRYLLTTASMAAIAATLPNWVPALLVRRSIWSVDRALADATARPAGFDQICALADLIEVVPEPERPAMAMLAFTATGSGFGDLGDELMAAITLNDDRIRRYIPEDRWNARIDELIEVSRGDLTPADTLLHLAGLVPADRRTALLTEIVGLARASGRENYGDVFEVQALTALALHAPQAERADRTKQALCAARMLADADRVDALVELVPLLDGWQRRRVLWEALRTLRSLEESVRLPKQLSVAAKMQGRGAAKLVDEVVAHVYAGCGRREELIPKLADRVPRTSIPRLATLARTIYDPRDRARVLTVLAGSVDGVDRELLLTEATAAARAIPLAAGDSHDRIGALAAIADLLPDDRSVSLLHESLTTATASIHDEAALAVGRAGLARFASAARAQRERAAAIEQAHRSENQYDLQNVAVYLPEPERSTELRRLVDGVLALPEPMDFAGKVAALAPDLPAELALRLLPRLDTILDDLHDAVDPTAFDTRKLVYNALGRLAERVPSFQRREALPWLVYIMNDRDFADALQRLVSSLRPGEIQALADAVAVTSDEYRKALLFALVLAPVAAARREAVAEGTAEALDVASRVSPVRQSLLLPLLARYLSEPRREAAIATAVTAARQIKDAATRAVALVRIAREASDNLRHQLVSEAVTSAGQVWISSESGSFLALGTTADEILPRTWFTVWTPILDAVADRRSHLGRLLAGAATELDQIGGTAAVDAALDGLDDVQRWWP